MRGKGRKCCINEISWPENIQTKNNIKFLRPDQQKVLIPFMEINRSNEGSTLGEGSQHVHCELLKCKRREVRTPSVA